MCIFKGYSLRDLPDCSLPNIFQNLILYNPFLVILHTMFFFEVLKRETDELLKKEETKPE